MAKKKELSREPKILGDQEFEQALTDARTHREDVKTLQDRQALIDADLMATLFSKGETGLKDSSGTWSIQSRETKTIDRAMLIAAGVDVQVIDDCTKVTNSEPYLILYPKKKGKSESEAAE